jgi:hypothetical protein
LLALVAVPSSDRLRKYRAVEAYEIRPGIIATPFYSDSHELCEISIERRHYADNAVDMDATMSKEQIVSMFDELAPKEERGGSWSKKFPPDTEFSEGDGGVLDTHIPYENVTLRIYGSRVRPEWQKYVAAIIVWNKVRCDAKGM